MREQVYPHLRINVGVAGIRQHAALKTAAEHTA
jgi:hypothetical protein